MLSSKQVTLASWGTYQMVDDQDLQFCQNCDRKQLNGCGANSSVNAEDSGRLYIALALKCKLAP